MFIQIINRCVKFFLVVTIVFQLHGVSAAVIDFQDLDYLFGSPVGSSQVLNTVVGSGVLTDAVDGSSSWEFVYAPNYELNSLVITRDNTTNDITGGVTEDAVLYLSDNSLFTFSSFEFGSTQPNGIVWVSGWDADSVKLFEQSFAYNGSTSIFTLDLVNQGVQIPNILIEFLDLGNNYNGVFQLDNIHVTPVPLPAAVWLFGSGLIGLFGFSRRKKSA